MSVDRKKSPEIKELSAFNIVEAEKQILPNGLPLYFINTGTSELIKIEWMFAAGNWYQQSPLVAFTVNNMLAEGTTSMNSRQIAESIEFYGAYLGYTVDKDNAFISIVCLRKYLPRVLEIVADIIKHPSFPQSELDIFIQKHKQQFLVDQNKVGSVARMIHARMLFGGNHPYGYYIKESDFGQLDRSQLFDFFNSTHHSGNCKIIASGKVLDEDIELINNYFGKENWGVATTVKPGNHIIEAEPVLSINQHKDEAVQNAIRIGKIVISKTHPDYAGLTVLNCILGGYFGSRLMKKIREEKGYTYGISSMLITLRHAGYFTIVSEVGADVTQPAIDDIYGEIEKLRTTDVPGDELDRVKNYMLGEMIRMFDGPFAQAETFISLLEYDMGYEYFRELIAVIKSITPAEIRSLANKYLSDGMSQVIVGKIQ